MTLVKVRHALATWQDEKYPNGVLTAFRGQVVDMPDAEIERLKPHGAVVDHDAELDRPGVLLELPQAPTDEELIAWVLAASPMEVGALALDRPELADRLESAARHITNERARQDAHLEAVRAALANPEPRPASAAEPTLEIDSDIVMVPQGGVVGGSAPAGEPAAGVAPAAPSQPGSESEAAPAASITLAQVVAGSVDDVSAYLTEHPDQAQAVLDAENAARSGQPRAGVIRAVQVAASHTG